MARGDRPGGRGARYRPLPDRPPGRGAQPGPRADGRTDRAAAPTDYRVPRDRGRGLAADRLAVARLLPPDSNQWLGRRPGLAYRGRVLRDGWAACEAPQAARLPGRRVESRRYPGAP